MDKPRICKRCNGNGYYETVLRDLGGRQPDGLGVQAIVPCEMCDNGIVTPEILEAYRKSWQLTPE
jgi:hypothetical protein